MGLDAVTEAQCKRWLNEQQISMGKKMDAVVARNQEPEATIRNLNINNGTVAATNTSHSSSQKPHQQDQRSSVRDSQGKKWHQVKFCCSKHGFNTSHSNENCNNKHVNKGHPWVPGATPSNTKGGNNALEDKFNHWFERSSRQHLPQPPN